MMQANEEKVAALVGNLTQIMGQLAKEVGASDASYPEEKEVKPTKSKAMMSCQACGHEESCPSCCDDEEAPEEHATDEEDTPTNKDPSIIGRLMVLKKSKS